MKKLIINILLNILLTILLLLGIISFVFAAEQAKRVTVNDDADYYTGTTVEAILAELGIGSAGIWFRNTTSGYLYPTTITDSIGIGTTSPSALLDIGGGAATYIDGTDDVLIKDDLEVDGDTYLGNNLTVLGSTYLADIFVTPNDFGVAGNLGVGITAPIYKIDVRGAGDAIFNNTGNLGIGTTNPITPLNIQGTLTELALSFGDGDSGFFEQYDDDIRITIGGTVRYGFNTVQFTNYGLTNSASITWEEVTATNPVFAFNSDFDTGIGRAAADILSLIAGGDNGLNVIDGGNVGIGNTNPLSLLHIDNGGTFTIAKGLTLGDGDSGLYEWADDHFGFWLGGSKKFEMGSGVFSGAAADTPAMRDSAGTTTVPAFTNRSDQNTGIGWNAADSMAFIAGGNNIMNVTSANVGIGTTDPTVDLEVADDVLIGDTLVVVDNLGVRGNHASETFYMKYDATLNEGYFQVIDKVVMKLDYDYNAIIPSGNLGIGTTDPGAKLEVDGNIYPSTTGYNLGTNSLRWLKLCVNSISFAGADAYSIGYNYFKGGTTSVPLYVYNQAGGVLALQHTGGNVGIGTTAPATLLQVTGGHLYIGTGTAPWNNQYNLSSASSDLGLAISVDQPSDTLTGRALAMGTAAESYTRMIFYSNGFLGFGSGSATRDTFIGRSTVNTIRIGSDYDGTGVGHLIVNGNVGIGTTDPQKSLHIYDATLNLNALIESGDTDVWLGFQDSNTTNNTSVYLGAIGDNMDFHTGSTGADAMRIASDGNVGIGTTAPVSLLDVAGTSFLRGDTGDNGLYVEAGGQVGIGITAPLDDLHVVNNIRTNSRVSTSDGTAALPAYRFVSEADVGIYKPTTNELGFSTDGAERVRIDASGNVGIGTTNPGYALTVEGSVQADDYYSGDATQGATATVTVRNQAGDGTCDIVYKDGLYVSTTCP